MKNISLFIKDLFFPNRCPCCNSFIKWDRLICDKCSEILPYSGTELCRVCGKAPCLCGTKLYYNGAEAVFYYRDNCIGGIYALKNDNGINFAEFGGKILADKIKTRKINFDIIVSVPMSGRKEFDRGYNQAEEIAKVLSRHLNIPAKKNVLIKKDFDIEQHTLTAEDRQSFVKKEFFIGASDNIKGKNVILCDDVLTTGSTINYCSYLLLEMGAKSVFTAVLATTELDNVK